MTANPAALAGSYKALDWLVRVHSPSWLDAAGATTEAAALRGLPPITDAAAMRAAWPAIRAGKAKAHAAKIAAMRAILDASDDWRAAWWTIWRPIEEDARRATMASGWDGAWIVAEDASRTPGIWGDAGIETVAIAWAAAEAASPADRAETAARLRQSFSELAARIAATPG